MTALGVPNMSADSATELLGQSAEGMEYLAKDMSPRSDPPMTKDMGSIVGKEG